MEFKVSNKKFVQNELLSSALLLIVLSVIFRIHFSFAIIMFLWIYIYKEIKYYRDMLYIAEKNIRLNKYKRYNSPGSVGRASKIVEEEYKLIKVESFKENLNQFTLYGKVEIKKTINKRKIFNDNAKREEYKTEKKLVIRKNFENEKEIRNLLKRATESNEIINAELVYDKYYRIKDKNAKEEMLFKVDRINKLWMYLDKKGKWNKCGDLDNVFENKKENFEEITEDEAMKIQDELNTKHK